MGGIPTREEVVAEREPPLGERDNRDGSREERVEEACGHECADPNRNGVYGTPQHLYQHWYNRPTFSNIALYNMDPSYRDIHITSHVNYRVTYHQNISGCYME